MPATADRRSNADHHKAAARRVRNAVRELEAALKEEDGLEWDGALRGILDEATHVQGRLETYARMGG